MSNQPIQQWAVRYSGPISVESIAMFAERLEMVFPWAGDPREWIVGYRVYQVDGDDAVVLRAVRPRVETGLYFELISSITVDPASSAVIHTAVRAAISAASTSVTGRIKPASWQELPQVPTSGSVGPNRSRDITATATDLGRNGVGRGAWGTTVMVHEDVYELLGNLLSEYKPISKLVMAQLLSALERLELTGSPGEERPARPPIRRFTREFDSGRPGEERQWLWVYFADLPVALGAGYLVLGVYRAAGATINGNPPEPSSAAWDIARNRLGAS